LFDFLERKVQIDHTHTLSDLHLDHCRIGA
jgi:hypothetical protein